MNRSFLFAFIVGVASFGIAAAQAKPMTIPGSNWSMDLPEGFSVQQKMLPSFVDKAGTTLILFDAPAQPLKGSAVPKQGDKTDSGTDDEALLQSVEELQVDGHAAWLMQQRFEKQHATGLTLIVEGVGSNANVVTRLSDEQLKTVKLADIRALFMTLKEKVLSDDERLAALPFDVKDPAGMRLAGVAGNAMAVFTDGPEKNPDKAPAQAFVFVILSPPGPGVVTPEILAVFDKQGMMDGLIKHQLPGAIPGTHKPILMAQIPALQVPYTRAANGGAAKLAGEVRFMGADKQLLMIYSSYPEGDEAKASATAKLVDSVSMKAAK